MAVCDGGKTGIFAVAEIIQNIFFNPIRCLILEPLQGAIASFVDRILATRFFGRIVMGTPFPGEPDDPLWMTASNLEEDYWERAWEMNSQFADGAMLFLFLGVVIVAALTSIRVIDGQTGNQVYRRGAIAFVLILFNKEIAGLFLRFSDWVVRFVGPGGAGQSNACFVTMINAMLAGIGLAFIIGLGYVIFLAIVVIVFLAVQYLRLLLIVTLFIFLPLFVTGWAVSMGPLSAIGEKGQKGAKLLVMTAFANLPMMLLWQAGCVIFVDTDPTSTSYFHDITGLGVADSALGLVATLFFFVLGLFLTIYTTWAGSKVTGSVKKAAGMAYAKSEGGSVAAGMVGAGVSPIMAQRLNDSVTASAGQRATERLNDNLNELPFEAEGEVEYDTLGQVMKGRLGRPFGHEAGNARITSLEQTYGDDTPSVEEFIESDEYDDLVSPGRTEANTLGGSVRGGLSDADGLTDVPGSVVSQMLTDSKENIRRQGKRAGDRLKTGAGTARGGLPFQEGDDPSSIPDDIAEQLEEYAEKGEADEMGDNDDSAWMGAFAGRPGQGGSDGPDTGGGSDPGPIKAETGLQTDAISSVVQQGQSEQGTDYSDLLAGDISDFGVPPTTGHVQGELQDMYQDLGDAANLDDEVRSELEAEFDSHLESIKSDDSLEGDEKLAAMQRTGRMHARAYDAVGQMGGGESE